MLKALTVSEVLAIAEASSRRTRDERAMVEYLGLGTRRRAPPGRISGSSLLKAGAVDLSAFDSSERQGLATALGRLTENARRELIALVWIARSPSLDFDAALRRTRRIPVEAQTGYLMGLRLERYLAPGLEKLGYRTRP